MHSAYATIGQQKIHAGIVHFEGRLYPLGAIADGARARDARGADSFEDRVEKQTSLKPVHRTSFGDVASELARAQEIAR